MEKIRTIFNGLIIISIILFSSLCKAQTPVFSWAHSYNNWTFEINSVTTDVYGYVYTTGYFSGVYDFDPSPNSVFELESSNSKSMFIQKLDSEGNFISAKKLSGHWNSDGEHVKTDNLGNVYITGLFQSYQNIDSIGFFHSTTPAHFVLKLGVLLEYMWHKKIDSEPFESISTISVGNDGSIVIGGEFKGTLHYNPDNLDSSFTTDSFIYEEGYIVKYSSNGDFVWANHINGKVLGIVSQVYIDQEDNVLMIGSFTDSTVFNLQNDTIISVIDGGFDILILKIDVNGDYVWLKQFGGPGYDKGTNISTDNNGNIYCVGTFRDTVDFDPNTPIQNLYAITDHDLFIQKLTPEGNLVWVKQFGVNHYSSEKLVLTKNKNILISGYFADTVDFDPGDNFEYLSTDGNDNCYILKLDSNGAFIWVEQFNASINSIASTAGDDFYSIGNFEDSVDFDPLDSEYFMFANNVLPFVFKWKSCITNTVDNVNACGNYTWINGVNYTFSNNTATHTLANIYGCDSIVTLNLELNGTLDKTIWNNNDSIIVNNSNATYQWLDCESNFSLINGEVSQFFIPQQNGSYAVELYENGCIDTSVCFAFNTFGLDDEYLESNFEIIPNPVNESLNIYFSDYQIQAGVKIYNSLGQVIYTKTFSNTNQISIELSILPGVYMVELSSEKPNHIINKIFIKN